MPGTRFKLGGSLVMGLFALIGVTAIIKSQAAPNPNLIGDLNSDNVVNLTDLSMLLSNWGKTLGTTTPTPTPPTTPPSGSGDSGAPSCGTAGNATTTVSSASALSSAVSAAKAGDVIVVSADITSGVSISGKSVSGTPVTIKAASRGVTALNSVQITNSSGITVEGFKFGPNSASTYVKVASSTNIRIMRNIFDSKNVATSQSSIVTSGTSNGVDVGCNEFRDKNQSGSGGTKITGSYIKTQFDDPNMTKNLHVFRNYFHVITPYIPAGDTVPAGDSDREAIAMGIADSQDIVTNNIVEYNLFEDCDGENEIITTKTSNNIFRHNTFKNSMGSLSFRLGHNNEASDNYFYGSGASAVPSDANYQTGGIRVYGASHTLKNNFMKGLTGISWRLPILLDSGDTADSTGADSHEVATNDTVTGNTILDSVGGGIHVGSSNYGKQPSGNTVTNNIVSAGQGILFEDLASGGTWTGNKGYASGSATLTGGAAKTAAQVQALTAAPAVSEPAPLTTANVGPAAP